MYNDNVAYRKIKRLIVYTVKTTTIWYSLAD